MQVSDLMAVVEKDYLGKPISVGPLFNIFNLNSLWRITTSEKLAYNDPKLKKLTDVMDKTFKELTKPFNQVNI